MIIGKVELNESAQLEFGLEVSGTSGQKPSARFVIEGKAFDFSFNCQEAADGSITVQIPKMKGLIESGLHNCRLEVLADNKLFVPLSEQIEFNPLIEMEVKIPSTQKDSVAVHAKGVKVVQTAQKTEEPVTENAPTQQATPPTVDSTAKEPARDSPPSVTEAPTEDYPPAFDETKFRPVVVTKRDVLKQKIAETEAKLAKVKAARKQ